MARQIGRSVRSETTQGRVRQTCTPPTIATRTATPRTMTAAFVAPAATRAPPIIGSGMAISTASTVRRSRGTALRSRDGTSAYCLRVQGFIATRRRVLVMVSSSRGFVEGVR
jgi:hypothetical protein